ncbi:hypothetical protein RM543_00895 [Roseicyclus sp. F158]|uniref:Uncharacterized protein n=1 Tax=Tropicimonas omnivorans TaxID=3075590 RepID=A0ABU3DCE8_9RHOB|nr:hypothetical protein [Roseicyclus sp. F158]MDT0681224.1 hypothetical protein [Roseicyclus sp. F158]
MFKTLSLVAASALVPGAALAQDNCADRSTVIERLEGSYDESFSGGGLQSSEKILEVWHSEIGGTWTVLLTDAEGISCVIAAGTHWRDGLVEKAGIPM